MIFPKIKLQGDDMFEIQFCDIKWIHENWDFESHAFLDQFIENWKKYFGRNFSGTNIEFAKNVLNCNRNASYWNKNLQSANLNIIDNEHLIEEFREQLCGFKQIHLQIELYKYEEEIKRNLDIIENTITSVKNTLKSLSRKRDKGKYYYLTYRLEKIKKVKNYLKSELENAPLIDRSSNKLMRKNSIQNNPNSLRYIGFLADMDIKLLPSDISLEDLSFSNPFRHLYWISVSAYSDVDDIMKTSRLEMNAIQRIEKEFELYKLFDFFNEQPFLNERKGILNEVIKSAKSECYTAASLLLFTQTEGILLDLALEINDKLFKTKKMEIFPDINNYRQYISRKNNKKEEWLSIETLMFDSMYRDFFWPGFLEYFNTEFYSERCRYAHGEGKQLIDEISFKKILLFTLTVLNIYFEYLETNKPPILSNINSNL
ncbi:MAG: hypothetical protein AB7S75_24235 [Desulfococcaceae bacterium]